jgi:hypothetical protein
MRWPLQLGWCHGQPAGAVSVAHLLLLGSAAAVACRDHPTAPPATLTIQKAPTDNGDRQTDTVLATMAPLRVLVRAGDADAGGVKVYWRVSLDTVVATTVTISDQSGIASLALTFAARPGVYTVEARLGPDMTPPGVTFSATATSGHPTGFRIVSGQDQTDTATATLGSDYVIQVTDGHGNGVIGAVIEWTVTAGGGAISPTRSTTVGPEGLASARRTLGRVAGENDATATVLAVNDGAGFRAMGLAAHPTTLKPISGDQQNGETNRSLPADYVVAVTDSYGNGAAGVAIDWTIVAGGGTLSSTRSTTGTDGTAATRATLGTNAGVQRVSATANGLATAATVTFSSTAVAPSPTPAPPPGPPPPGSPPPPPPPQTGLTLLLVGGGGQSGGIGQTLSTIIVSVTNSSGSPVAGVTLDFTIVSGGGTVTPKATTNAAGLADVQWTLGPTTGTQTITAKLGPSSLSINATATLTPFLRLYSWYDPNTDHGEWDGPSVGIGQYHNAIVLRPSFAELSSPLTVTLAHSGLARTSLPSSVVIPAGSTTAGFLIAGTSAGNDEIVAAAPGYTSATASVWVDKGYVSVFSELKGVEYNWILPLKALDSLQVAVVIGPPYSDDDVWAVAPTTFALATNGNVQFVSGGVSSAPVGSITIPANGRVAWLWLKGLSAGNGSVTITNANYLTFSVTISVSPP